ncbi:MAG: hypothetical protein AAFV95_24725 [Bacteroidota bacterium]
MKKAKKMAGMMKTLFQADTSTYAPRKKKRKGLRLRGATPAAKVTKQDDPGLKNLIEFIRKETPLPDSLIEWLGLLGLLYGVPFNNLVPDEKMLANDVMAKNLPAREWLSKLSKLYNIPSQELVHYQDRLDEANKQLLRTNALRFFYIDPNWIDSLINGALSVGVHNSVDFRFQLAIHKAIKVDIEQAMINHRAEMMGKPLAKIPQEIGTIAGLLFRSPIVTQWTGLEIVGYKSTNADPKDKQQMIPALRISPLSPTVILVLFQGVPKKVLIKEPSEGATSGFTAKETIVDGKVSFTYEMALRKFKGEFEIGKPYEDASGNSVMYQLQDKDFRNKEKRTLNIRNLRRNVLGAIKVHDTSVKARSLRPRDMGVELINSPRYFSYTPSGKLNRKKK